LLSNETMAENLIKIKFNPISPNTAPCFASHVLTPHNKTTQLNEPFALPKMLYVASSVKPTCLLLYGPKHFTLPPS
jgi:hypothetical protein